MCIQNDTGRSQMAAPLCLLRVGAISLRRRQYH